MHHNWFDQFSISDDEICCQYLDVKTAFEHCLAKSLRYYWWLPSFAGSECVSAPASVPCWWWGCSVSLLGLLWCSHLQEVLILHSHIFILEQTLQMQEHYCHDHHLPACLFNSVVGALSPVQNLRQLSGCPAQRRATQEILRYLV